MDKAKRRIEKIRQFNELYGCTGEKAKRVLREELKVLSIAEAKTLLDTFKAVCPIMLQPYCQEDALAIARMQKRLK